MKWSSLWRPVRDEPDPAASPSSEAADPPPVGPPSVGPTAPPAGYAGRAGQAGDRGGLVSAVRAELPPVVVPGPVGPDSRLLLLAACDPRIPAELRELRGRMPGIEFVLVASVDGAVLAHDPARGDVAAAGRIALAMLDQGGQATVALGRGRFRNTVIWGTDGYLAVYAIGQEALLLIQASEEARVGRLHMEARSSATTIAGLLAPG